MRVVHVNVVRPRGHPEPDALLRAWPTLADVATAVAAAGADVTVVQSFDRDAEIVRDGVRFLFVRELAIPGRATGVQPSRFAAAVRDCRPDVIHMNGLEFARHSPALSRLGVPVLAQDHASRPGTNRARRKRALAGVAGVAFTAAAQAEPFVAEGSIPPRVPVFAVPESSTHFTPGSPEEARAETRIHGDPAVLWVGRLDANKDPLTILAAIELAATSLPGLRLWCCFHEQPLIEAVRQRISASESLSRRVHLIGRVSHERIEALCRAADFLILGSHHEGSGYALMEALACGTTPVVSDIPAFRELTGNGTVGALVEPGDSAGFASALIDLARRPREELREQAVRHFKAQLSFERVGARLLAIYGALTGPRA
jgi:glycosyltransferase involved in cell wall biosynthesis